MSPVKSKSKQKLSDDEWKKLVEKNAKHSARLLIETENPQKIAEVLNSIPVLKALEFLFELAEKHRKEKKFIQAKVLLEAATLIDRKTGEETDLSIEIDKQNTKEEDTTLFVKRYTPAEVFEMPIKKQKTTATKTKSPSKSQASSRR